ncbi:CocE/NonD family hydrolase [Terracoccus luteus]|uniref:Xaa-Pro dipeptidyl-peptidase C-terminal domain-containing protein n=1 Tax=Terracoccus luteus TaxID=53356 RepID=A0A839Q0A0_9MICO|nr:CocE/NonD family hydrolase [Terracoccus luteus]MBB2986482.1 hypothetical protein [Terracoccus luteus]MCP2171929.1 hypothetical protein [Terracoccus luteus]
MTRPRSFTLLAALTLTGVAAATFTAPLTAQAATIPTPGNPVSHDENPRVPVGALWTEEYFPSSDGSDVVLHADVLRPENLPADAKTPVILSVGPYFAHRGQTGDDGFEGTGPSERFDDLIVGADLMSRGYTVVMVDLRGFGGSTGCLDWVGPGEQADVRAAVNWATKQAWSTGKVGMYGKSYDASTGLVGTNQAPPGLKAVVAQEPVWDMYNYLFSNGVRRPNYLGTPRAYNSIADIQGMPDDSEQYKAAAAYEKTHPECYTANLTDTQDPNANSAYWRARNLAERAKSSTVPLFVTQGFIEPNTKPEDIEKYLQNHQGTERGWLGQWEHVRGNDVDGDGTLLMGREGWFDEVMRFYDKELKGIKPAVNDPAFVIEDNLGQWRAQSSWPEVRKATTVTLRPGSYVDDGGESGARRSTPAPAPAYDMENAPALPPASAVSGSGAPATSSAAADASAARRAAGPKPGTTADDNGYYSWSKPVAKETRITGTPRISLQTRGTGNVLVRLWDVAPDGTATMFDEQMSLVSGVKTAFDLKSVDWTLAAGHQLVVGVGTNTSFSWADTPSNETITVKGATLALDLQNTRFDTATQGDRSPYLDGYLRYYTTTLPETAPGTFAINVPQSRG